MEWSDVGVTKLKLHGKHGSGLYALVDGDYDGEYFAQFRWYLGKNGYVTRLVCREDREDIRKRYSYLHHEVLKAKPGQWRDHINRNRLDNRSCNLRLVSPSESAMNRNITQNIRRKQGIAVNTKTGYRGVHNPIGHIKTTDGTILYKKRYTDRFYASIRKKRIGLYPTAIEAAKAYDTEAIKLYGDRAVLNFPIAKQDSSC